MKNALVLVFALIAFSIGVSALVMEGGANVRGESLYVTKPVVTESGWWLWYSKVTTTAPGSPASSDFLALLGGAMALGVGGLLILAVARHFPSLATGEVEIVQIVKSPPKAKKVVVEEVATEVAVVDSHNEVRAKVRNAPAPAPVLAV
jgi:hypothetical protein